MEEGPLSGETIPGKGFSSNLAVKNGKSVIAPMGGEGINKEDKEKLPLQKESSPPTAAWPYRTLDPRSLTLDGVMSERAEKTSLPQRESRAPAAALNSVSPEGTSLPDEGYPDPCFLLQEQFGQFHGRRGKRTGKSFIDGE